MNWHIYFLVVLLIWAQVDDFWVPAPVSPSAPLAVDDDDEYLPSQRRLQEEECSSPKKPVFVGLRAHTADLALVRRGVPPVWNLTTPFAPPPLHVFMSLQI
jgi:hypothetical protein